MSGCFPNKDILAPYSNSKNIELLFVANFVASTKIGSSLKIKDKVPDYEIKIKDKNFVCFNRVDRMHRLNIFAYLSANNLLEKGFFSFQGSNPKWREQSLADERIDIKVKRELLKHFNEFPFTLNITEERFNPVDVIEDDFKYHINSYFSIVNETCYFKHDEDIGLPFLTEKGVRCFVLRHPFVVVSSVGYLKAIKTLGFKTFHPYINEDYDLIEDDYLRLEFIYKEIHRLCNQSNEQWIEWQKFIKPIVDYNFNLVWDIKDYEIRSELDGF